MYKELVGYIILLVTLVLYFIYTIRFTKTLKPTLLFSPPIKYFHLIMIWIVPFLWLIILKALTSTTPGSHEVEKKQNPEPFSGSNTVYVPF